VRVSRHFTKSTNWTNAYPKWSTRLSERTILRPSTSRPRPLLPPNLRSKVRASACGIKSSDRPRSRPQNLRSKQRPTIRWKWRRILPKQFPNGKHRGVLAKKSFAPFHLQRLNAPQRIWKRVAM
jgi:hypothetical protein